MCNDFWLASLYLVGSRLFFHPSFMPKFFLFAILLCITQLASSCQTDADVRPTNYDVLALGTGHWEWDRTTLAWAGNRTPSTEGYTRQLVFGAGGQLLLRRSGQADYRTSYQLSMGTFPRCGAAQSNSPIVTYVTGEEQLPNNDRRGYTITQRAGQQELALTGEDACVDGGAFETYHWVAE
jgi:hypothetical protein